MKNYIILLEDGAMLSTDKCDEDTLSDCDAGIIDLIDISIPSVPMQYFDGKWHKVERI